MRIGELGKKTSLNPKTIRYYEGIGLLPPPPRTSAGYRQYSEQDLERLGFIRSAQALGIALQEIKEVLGFRDRGTCPCPYVLQLIDAKVRETESRIRGLRMLADDLKRLKKAAAAIPPAKLAAKARFCHVIENQALLQRAGQRHRTKGTGPSRRGE